MVKKHRAKNWTLILVEPSKHHQLILFQKKHQPDHGQGSRPVRHRFPDVGPQWRQQVPSRMPWRKKISQGWFCVQQHKKVGEIEYDFMVKIFKIFKCKWSRFAFRFMYIFLYIHSLAAKLKFLWEIRSRCFVWTRLWTCKSGWCFCCLCLTCRWHGWSFTWVSTHKTSG